MHQYVEQQGSGTPIVFIHGSFASTSTWKKMVEVLAVSHHCISIKLPGHCGMPNPKDFSLPSVQSELAIIEQVVNELTNQPIHLVGHSYGGVVALAQALKGTLNISQLTLFEPVAVWVLDVLQDTYNSAQVKTFLEKYRHNVANNTPYACGQLIDFWGGQGSFEVLPNFIKDSMNALTKNNIRHWDICTQVSHSSVDLNNCTIPTKVVCGTQSNPVAAAIAMHLNDQMPNSKGYAVDGASHFLVTSHVDKCLSVLKES